MLLYLALSLIINSVIVCTDGFDIGKLVSAGNFFEKMAISLKRIRIALG